MSPNRIDAAFTRLKSRSQKAFIAYLTAGDPNLEMTPGLVMALERAGVDILELGVPFSDPVADGPTIQQAFQRALAQGTTLAGVIKTVAIIRKSSEIPLVLFTYYNPVMRYGFEAFVKDAVKAGADGLLLLDLPPEEAETERALAREHGLHWVTLIAPTTPDERLGTLARAATGFVYYVSREGVTGMQSSVSTGVAERTQLIRSHATAPVCVGFGISTPEQVRSIASSADGVVVGSAIVNQIEKAATTLGLNGRIEAFTKPLADAAHEVAA